MVNAIATVGDKVFIGCYGGLSVCDCRTNRLRSIAIADHEATMVSSFAYHKATLFVPGMAWGCNTSLYGGSAASFSTIYIMKYFTPSLSWSSSWDAGQDFYLIRYAEVLLSLAEAYIESNKNLDAAVNLIDQVRQRAGMPTVEQVEGTGLSQAALRDIVRHERRVELAFEGLRLFDLYRWHTLKDAVDRINAEAERYGFAYEYRNYRGEQEYVWPIPLTELDSNSELTQNELWK